MTECIRRARPDEAAELSDLALRSKAVWGYDAAFIERCQDDLTVTPEALVTEPYYVLEQEGRVLGFYSLATTPGGVFLDNLFVAPPAVGRGVGKRLWAHMAAVAQTLGYETVLILSDPHAEGFYRSRGAERVGSVPSSVFAGRSLPLLRFAVPGQSGAA